VLAQARAASYAAYTWPRSLAPLFARNGMAVSVVVALSVAAFILGFAAWHDPAVLFGTHTGPGAFYRLMPHNAMAALFGAVFLYAILALAMGVRTFWRDIGDPIACEPRPLWQAVRDAATLRYLDGGGIGCYNHDERPNDRRRFYHHQTFYGFMLCFAATCVATVYHYVLGRVAPYPWWDLPVVLGTVGGIGLIFGPLGLMIAKLRRDPAMQDQQRLGMDFAFLAMLFLTSLTGLLLLVLRATPAMPLLLALHLGVVFALFITLPYGKFVHGIYRFVALVRYAQEHRALSKGATT
jgi:citrate/tricarballylate utilization protein